MLSSTSRVSELVVCHVDIVCVLMVGPAEHIQQRQRIRGEGVRAGLGCGVGDYSVVTTEGFREYGGLCVGENDGH